MTINLFKGRQVMDKDGSIRFITKRKPSITKGVSRAVSFGLKGASKDFGGRVGLLGVEGSVKISPRLRKSKASVSVDLKKVKGGKTIKTYMRDRKLRVGK